ncbi:TATA element modulatory factor [Lucilia cuprina]|uniref:TATA element modulatory factor n=1 Tax=Lucilia cuprina TaxID=7375 RepID=UPI001F067B8D|nr:TATA element modulatory factor [Lucilia cuprina]
MSWFDTKSFASLAKTALKEAQKKIDKVLDIQEDELDGSISASLVGENALDGSIAGTITTEITGNVKRFPGAANRSESADDAKPSDAEESPMQVSASSPDLSAETFLKEIEQKEMITTPPKVGEITKEIEALTATASGLEKATVVPVELPDKRTSVASTLESVDVLSPPQISPCSDETTDISESVELITATSDIMTSESERLLPATATSDSIVIIGRSSDAGLENEINVLEMENTNLDDSGNFDTKTLVESMEDTTQRTFTAMDSSTASNKLLQSMEMVPYELQTIDSDSTQSFEDVQLHSPASGVNATNSQLIKKISRSSKSDTSPPNSNDEMETATSSDIEIISNPNGDASSTASTTTRTSPLKDDKKAENTNISLPPLAANNSLLIGRKGHCREPSEISILSMDSQSEDEIEKLLKRISELNSIVEARELRLLQSERQNAELQERNNELQALVNTNNLQSSEEYTKRVSSLEKKFQNCIRERDTLRTKVKDLEAKIPKSDLNDALTESQNMVLELRQEGEKLAKEILQQSNIIKKLRAKEKTSDNQLKSFKDQLSLTHEEVERLKKTLSAKEEVERTQIEAVHKMTSENQRLNSDNSQMRSKLDDTQQKLNTLQRSFDAVKTELQQRSKQHSDLSRTAENVQAVEKEKALAKAENQELQKQLLELREKIKSTEQQAMKRDQQLREENRQLMARLEAAELRAESSTQEISQTTIPLMRHLESLQQTLNQRTANWNKEEKLLLEKLDAAQTRLKSLETIEDSTNAKIELLKSRCQELEEKLSHAVMEEEKTKISLQLELRQKETEYNRQISEINQELELSQVKIKTLEDSQLALKDKLKEAERKTIAAEENLHREQSSHSLTELQHSPSENPQRPHSPAVSAGVNSLEDGMGGSIDWHQDDLDCISNSGRPAGIQGFGVHYLSQNTSNFEYLQSMLKQRDGEVAQTQWELSRLQAERNMLQEELSQLVMEMENLKEKLQSLELLEINYNDLQTRYDALLQMYGEKVERCEELELDLKECKEAYKVQIQELLGKLRT